MRRAFCGRKLRAHAGIIKERDPLQQLYYEPQDDWGPDDFYALYRYLDRLFSSTKEHREPEIRELDLDRMCAETRYLMRHLLILQSNLRRTLLKYPNLRGLAREVEDAKLPIVLRDPPRHSWEYFRRHDIWL